MCPQLRRTLVNSACMAPTATFDRYEGLVSASKMRHLRLTHGVTSPRSVYTICTRSAESISIRHYCHIVHALPTGAKKGRRNVLRLMERSRRQCQRWPLSIGKWRMAIRQKGRCLKYLRIRCMYSCVASALNALHNGRAFLFIRLYNGPFTPAMLSLT